MSIAALFLRAIGDQARADTAPIATPMPPQQHRATLGWQRTFLSATDARQYDEGYAHWPAPMPRDLADSTPFSCGWLDHEHDDQEHEGRLP
jgi:hypothetical protein